MEMREEPKRGVSEASVGKRDADRELYRAKQIDRRQRSRIRSYKLPKGSK